jgi:hypothetical protein
LKNRFDGRWIVKKGCFAVLAGFLLLVMGVAFVAALQLDRQVGWSEAPAVSHADLAEEETRLRVAVQVDKLHDLILAHLPADIDLPRYLPMSLEALVTKALPREIALLGYADYAREEIKFRFFINERRGGPAFVDLTNEAALPPVLQRFDWSSPRFRLQERGILSAQASIPLPDGLEGRLLQDWGHEMEGAPLILEGDHFFEALLDNRNGEILSLWGGGLHFSGQEWRRAFDMQNSLLVLGILPLIHELRIHADLAGPDALDIHLRIGADSTAATALNLAAVSAVTGMKDYVQRATGMSLEGTASWSDEEKALVGDFKLTGFEPILKKQIEQITAQLPKTAS